MRKNVDVNVRKGVKTSDKRKVVLLKRLCHHMESTCIEPLAFPFLLTGGESCVFSWDAAAFCAALICGMEAVAFALGA